MKRIIDTGITQELLNGDNNPQLQILNKLYVVDDRQKTFEKIQEVQADETIDEKERTKRIYELALGEQEASEILGLNLPVQKTVYLSYCIMAAITGEEPEELMQRAKESKNE